ncbi:MAG: type II toxin-antitoxin system VapC family toxin [Candidatus Electrothrix aestuarii]|uniref:Type II toxin-antitoxin system VapC family toxin n=1 Tax=Candidatus Electrothrix aestuarii TaxID=3062594 RepID=A0AAU8LYR9_9BACT
MRVLLDTCAFLWFIGGSERLSRPARDLMEDFDNSLYLSLASLWEIAIKINIGKLELAQPFATLIPEQLETHQIKLLQIHPDHLSQLLDLPLHHRDPFDRLIIAQAICERLPIISCDQNFPSYPVKLIW